MTMSIICAVMLIVSAAVCWSVSRVRFNAGSLTACAWLVVLLLASLPGVLDPSLLPKTKRIIFWIGVGCLGFAVGWALMSSRRESTSIRVSSAALRKTHRILLALLAVGTAIDIYNLYPVVHELGGFGALWAGGGGGADFRLLAISERQAQLAGGANWFAGILTYLAAPGLLAPITGALMWKGRKFLDAAFPLAIVGLRAVVILERTSFMMSLLLFLLSLSLLRLARVEFDGVEIEPQEKSQRKLSRIVVAAAALAVAVGALLLPLLARNSGTTRTTGWASLSQYLLSSVGGLNYQIAVGVAFSPSMDSFTSQIGSYPGFGAYTFSGAFSVLRRVGLPLPFAPQFTDYYTIYLFGQPFSTNTSTMLRSLHMDFGTPGSYVALFLLFWASGWCARSVAQGNFRVIAVYAVVGGSLVWSFFGNGMIADFRYLFAMVGSFWIFSRIVSQPSDVQTEVDMPESFPVSEVN